MCAELGLHYLGRASGIGGVLGALPQIQSAFS
jgi:hypothetical protein